MTKDKLGEVLRTLAVEEEFLRKSGHAEYAGGENAFGNFERLSAELGIPREAVLWVYAMKHKDGIASHLRGHRSQRESVLGRILDLRLYLGILYAMIVEAEQTALEGSDRG